LARKSAEGKNQEWLSTGPRYKQTQNEGNRVRSIIAVVQRKGGVGKTTIAISLAGELSRRGMDVDVIDADPQKSAAEWAAPGRLPFPVSEIPIETGRASSWVGMIRASRGRITIIDTPPHEYAVGVAVAVADLVIVPCTPSGLDLSATEQAINAIEFAREKRKHAVPILIVPNRVDLRTLEGQQITEELAELGEIVCAPIGSRLGYVRAFSRGELPDSYVIAAEMAALGNQVLKVLGTASAAT
jgi:chromosome partitioning protein